MRSRFTRPRVLVASSVVTVVLLAVIVIVVVARRGDDAPDVSTGRTTTTTTTTTRPVDEAVPGFRFLPEDPWADGRPAPLTGLPVEDPDVLGRPLLAVKVDNLDVPGESARPQGGLAHADVVIEDAKNLNRLERFEKIEHRVQPLTDGSVAVIFLLTARPIIEDIQPVGNRVLSDDQIRAIAAKLILSAVDDQLIDRVARDIEAEYRRKGYYRVGVEADQAFVDVAQDLRVLRRGAALRIQALPLVADAVDDRAVLRKGRRRKKESGQDCRKCDRSDYNGSWTPLDEEVVRKVVVNRRLHLDAGNEFVRMDGIGCGESIRAAIGNRRCVLQAEADEHDAIARGALRKEIVGIERLVIGNGRIGSRRSEDLDERIRRGRLRPRAGDPGESGGKTIRIIGDRS